MQRSLASFLVALAFLIAWPRLAGAQPSDPAAAFFDNRVLHDIYLSINSRDFQTLKDHYLEDTYYPADFKWGTEVVRNVAVRSRGTGSRSGTKLGLRVDFDYYTTNQKFVGLKSLVLRNSEQDPTNMHEQIAMLLFRKLGLFAPRETFARLFINNAYQGVYSVVESIIQVPVCHVPSHVISSGPG